MNPAPTSTTSTSCMRTGRDAGTVLSGVQKWVWPTSAAPNPNTDLTWQLPLQVDLSCGTTNALLSVIEPEKCEYLFKVTTPALCYPPKLEEGGAQPKDEL